jgi:chemotaxis regulatin CheY-phosphate phosphatase CheZ
MPRFYLLSIEDDILNLMDEVDLDELLKEASEAIDDADRLSDFIREKSTIAVERFLVSYARFSPTIEL